MDLKTYLKAMAAEVDADGDRLQVTLEASALAQVAVALPHAADHWQLDSVQVDGRWAFLFLGQEAVERGINVHGHGFEIGLQVHGSRCGS